MDSNILTHIPREKYPEVLKTLKRDWPHSIHIYYLIKYFVDMGDKPSLLQLKVYCPENNTRDGIVVAMFNFKTYNPLMIHSVDDANFGRFEQFLKTANIFDWTQRLTFAATYKKWVPILESIAAEKGVNYYADLYHQVWLPPNKARNIVLDDLSNDGLELRDLEEEHADIIDKTWAYHGPNTYDIVRTSVLKGGIGLFVKGSKSPLAWNTIQHFYALGMLYTLEEHRKKGYGSIVTKSLSKKLSEAGIDPYACIKHDNIASMSTFTNLGFEKIDTVHWWVATPKPVSMDSTN